MSNRTEWLLRQGLHTLIHALACTFLIIHSHAFAQEPNVTAPIPPKTFYKEALKDAPKIASFEETAKWLDEGNVILLDLRSEQAFSESHIKGAVNLPATELTEDSLSKVIPSKDSKIVIYCENNILMTRKIPATTMSYPAIIQLGYKNTLVLSSEPFNKDISPLILDEAPKKTSDK